MHITKLNAKGFTLIEILVSLVIVAIGLLGLGSTQIMALKDNQDAYLYTQALTLSSEMADRIRANIGVWRVATLPTPASNCANSCNSVANSCTATAMAAYDYCIWITNAQSLLGSTAVATVVKSPVSGSTVCQGNSSKLCLRLSWAGNLQTNSKFDFEM